MLIAKITELPPGDYILEVHATEPVSDAAMLRIEAELRREADKLSKRNIAIVVCQPGIWLRVKRRAASLFRS